MVAVGKLLSGKRLWFACLALLVAATVSTTALARPAFADDEHELTSGGAKYTYTLENGEATVTAIAKAEGNGAETYEAIIPESVEEGGEEYLVTAIGPNAAGTSFSVTVYGDSSVKDSSLTRVVIPSKCLSVGDQAFVYCEALKSLEFAVDDEGACNVQSIGERAFAFTAIDFLALPDTVGSVGSYAFAECGELSTLYLPARQTVWGERVFLSTSAVELQAPEGCVTLPALTVKGASVTVPSTAQGSVSVGGPNVTSVSLPETALFDTLRLSFASLESFTVPEGVKTLTLSGSCPQIGFPKSLTSLTSIADDRLVDFEVPATVEAIGNMGFSGCDNLAHVSFADGSRIHSIGTYAFSGCSQLESVELPEGLEIIGSFAFSRCAALKEVAIPASVSSAIGLTLFKDCDSLTAIRFAEGSRVTALTTVAIDCPALETAVLPDGISTITRLRPLVDRYLFQNCPKLKTVVAPNPKLEILEDDFSGCGDFAVVGWGTAGRLVSSTEASGHEFRPIAELDGSGLNGAPNTAVVATGADSVRAVCAFGGSGNFPYVRALAEGSDYVVERVERDGLGFLVVTGVGDASCGSVEVAALQDISLAEADDISAQVSWNGVAVRPAVKLVLGGRALARGRDFTVEYRDNDRAGTATAVAIGAGSYTGQREIGFEVVERHELSAAGASATDRVSAALEAAALPGMPDTCEAVVVAWAHDHASVAAASALAVAEGAQLLVVSNEGGLTDAQKASVQGWGATRAIVVGGVAACGSGAVSDLAAAGLECEEAGVSAGSASALSVAVASAGSGAWGSTAVVANPADPALCLAAAAYAGAVRGPLVFTEGDGTLSTGAASALAGFANVVIVGDYAEVDASIESSLSGTSVYRAADSATLVEHGKDAGVYSEADVTYMITASAASENMAYAASAGRAKAPLTVS